MSPLGVSCRITFDCFLFVEELCDSAKIELLCGREFDFEALWLLHMSLLLLLAAFQRLKRSRKLRPLGGHPVGKLERTSGATDCLHSARRDNHPDTTRKDKSSRMSRSKAQNCAETTSRLMESLKHKGGYIFILLQEWSVSCLGKPCRRHLVALSCYTLFAGKRLLHC